MGALEDRWRRLLAAVAGVALAFSGIGALAVAPAAAEELPVTCTEPQVLAEDGVTCTDPPVAEEVVVEEETPEPLVCAEPLVLSEDGLSCVEPAPVVEEPAAPLECVEPQTLAEDGASCVDPAPAPTEEPVVSESAKAVEVTAAPSKIAFCHRTASHSNPYVYLNTSIQAFYHSGHISHTGPVYPDTGPDGKWGDIYPPNQYDGDGQNWGAGSQAFVDNGCADEPSKNPGISIDVEGCVYYDGYGYATIEVTNTDDKFYYELLLDGEIVDEGWGDDEISYSDYLEPGTYSVTVNAYEKGEEEPFSTVSTEFTVDPCPELGIAVDQITCTSGSDGTAMLHLTGLIEGEEYEWYVEGPGDTPHSDGTFTATGTSMDIPLGDLRPGNYTATVSWFGMPAVTTKTITPEPEPEWWVTATTTFTVVACPPGQGPKGPVLAATGSDAGPVNLALLLMVIGGGALMAARLRKPLWTDELTD